MSTTTGQTSTTIEQTKGQMNTASGHTITAWE